jgi:hypothetical protein
MRRLAIGTAQIGLAFGLVAAFLLVTVVGGWALMWLIVHVARLLPSR